VTKGRTKEIVDICFGTESKVSVSFIPRWSHNGSFHTPRSRQYLKSVFVLIVTYCHKALAMNKRVHSEVKAAEKEFFGGVYGVTCRDRVRSCKISKTKDVELLLF